VGWPFPTSAKILFTALANTFPSFDVLSVAHWAIYSFGLSHFFLHSPKLFVENLEASQQLSFHFATGAHPLPLPLPRRTTLFAAA